jgi:hypothetical protein
VVLRTPVTALGEDLEVLREHAEHEARAPQPLERRFVLRNFNTDPHA